MERRKPPLARVHPAAGERRAPRQGAHRGFRNRPEAHAADVDHRSPEERLPAEILADRERRRGQAVLLQHRIRVVDEQDRAGLVGVVGRPETDHAALGLRQAVDPAASGAVEGQFFAVVHEEILPEVLALLLEEIAQVPDDGIVAKNRVLLLRDVLDEDDHQKRKQAEPDQSPEAVRDDAQHAGHAFLPLRSISARTATRSPRQIIGENAQRRFGKIQGRMRRITDSGSSAEPFRISTSVAGRTPTTVQDNLSAIPASAWLASSTTLSSAMSVTVKIRSASSPSAEPSKRIPTSRTS